MMDISRIPAHAILTPHHGEFAGLWQKSALAGSPFAHSVKVQTAFSPSRSGAKAMTELEKTHPPGSVDEEKIVAFAQKYHCIVLLKGPVDIATNGTETRSIQGGNEGMTKGGTGDVLAGLIAALACKNDPFLATIAGSVFNKQAGDDLFSSVGPYFNASDLADQIPRTMKRLLTPASE